MGCNVYTAIQGFKEHSSLFTDNVNAVRLEYRRRISS
jgi:hypothetical protein